MARLNNIGELIALIIILFVSITVPLLDEMFYVFPEFYSGFALLIVMMSVTLYTAWALGNSWNILLNTWPEYRVHCRKPYPEIAFRAMGEHAR